MIVRYAATLFSSSLASFILLLLFGHDLGGAAGRIKSGSKSNFWARQISPRTIVSDACASYSSLERLNEKIRPAVVDLTHDTDFFSHYRVNLFHKRCPFWDDADGMCGNVACAVATLENEEDIPAVWRTEELSKLEGPRAKHPGKMAQREHPKKPLGGDLGADVTEDCVVEYDDECDDIDYCVPEDETATSKGDYVSLVQNPERYTGYAGDSAKQVWESIYRENCFQRSSFPSSANPGQSSWHSHVKGPAEMDFKQILDSAGRQHQLEQHRQQVPNAPFVAQTGNEVDDECIEKRVFYRVMSGMHASIATHLCWDYLNRTTGEWSPNLDCYIHRLHKFPDRISNLYFNYALVTRAIAKIGPYLQEPNVYTFCTGDRDEDSATRAKVLAVTHAAASEPEMFDENLMFQNGEGPSLKEDFRNRFRNVSRLMDCVGCDKCRLWGKLQTAGYGTALKVLFEFDNDSDNIPKLKRTELVALFNTYGKISHSLYAVGQFRRMAEERERLEEGGGPLSAIPDRARKPHHVIVQKPAEPEESHVENESHQGQGKTTGQKPATLKDEFDRELGRLIKATKIVVRSWVNFPALM
jgi:ERO1-like protein beta